MRNNDETIKYFLTDIKPIPLLPKDRQLELTELVQTGDSSAFEAMVKGNLRLVVNVAKKYRTAGWWLFPVVEWRCLCLRSVFIKT